MHSMNNELRNNSEVGAGGGDIFTDLHDSKPSTVKLTPEQLDEVSCVRLLTSVPQCLFFGMHL
ncbi:unnamed protein product [Trichobilharzia regenti]|nr:unnamed protein product [Trichobilharzia regenti]